jgi:hypothetical protein
MVVRRSFKAPDEAAVEMPQGVPGETPDASGETGPADAASPPEMTAGAPAQPAEEMPSPPPPDVTPVPESALAKARAALAAIEKELAWLARERDAALLADADDEAIRLYGEIEGLQRTRRALTDKVALLSVQAAELEAAERAAAREARIVEIERTLIERDAAAADLQDHLRAAEAAFRRVFELGLAARTAWAWPHGRLGGVLSSGSDLRVATMSYLYKIGGRPSALGGEYVVDALPSFPGGKCPRLELLQQPDKLPDLVTEFRQASRYAGDVMRGVAPEPVPASPPDTAGKNLPVDERSPVMPAVGITGGQSNVPTITPEMAEIIRRQVQLAMRDDPESEAEYRRNGELLAAMSA